MAHRLQIELSSHDQEIVDGATRKIAQFIEETHSHPPVALPLPVTSEEFSEDVAQRVHPRVIRVPAVSTELIAQLRQLQLPDGVDVSIK